MKNTETAYVKLIEGADELLQENAALHHKIQGYDDAVQALHLLHDETHDGAFRFCDKEVCKLFREWE